MHVVYSVGLAVPNRTLREQVDREGRGSSDPSVAQAEATRGGLVTHECFLPARVTPDRLLPQVSIGLRRDLSVSPGARCIRADGPARLQ